MYICEWYNHNQNSQQLQKNLFSKGICVSSEKEGGKGTVVPVLSFSWDKVSVCTLNGPRSLADQAGLKKKGLLKKKTENPWTGRHNKL